MTKHVYGSLALALVLTGCGPATMPMMAPAASPAKPSTVATAAALESPKATYIDGWATLNAPLVGATVSVYGTDGKLLATDKDQTYTTGAFLIPMDDVPMDFRLVVKGGTVNGQPFTGQLVAEVRNFNDYAQAVKLDLPSTLAAAYMGKAPDLSPDQAAADVAAQLGFAADPERPDEPAREFDADAFLAEAGKNDGLEAYVAKVADQLVARIAAPMAKDGALDKDGLLGNPLTSITAETALNLAKTAGGKAAEAAYGKAMGALGLSFEAKVISKLDALAAAIQKLDTKVNDLGLVTSQNGYDAKLATVTKLIAANNTMDREIKELLRLDPKNTEKVEAKKKSIRQIFKTNLLTGIDEWKNALAGVGAGDKTLTELFSELVDQKYPGFLNRKTAQMIQDQWDLMDGQQATTVRLTVEYKYSLGETDANIKELLKTWRDNRVLEMKVLRGCSQVTDTFDLSDADLGKTVTPLQGLPPATVIDKLYRKMWSEGTVTSNRWNGYADARNYALPFMERTTGKKGWDIPTELEFRQLIGNTACKDFQGFMGQNGFNNSMTKDKFVWTSGFYRPNQHWNERYVLHTTNGLYPMRNNSTQPPAYNGLNPDYLVECFTVRTFPVGEEYWYRTVAPAK